MADRLTILCGCMLYMKRSCAGLMTVDDDDNAGEEDCFMSACIAMLLSLWECFVEPADFVELI
jgi:hypothetical protein